MRVSRRRTGLIGGFARRCRVVESESRDLSAREAWRPASRTISWSAGARCAGDLCEFGLFEASWRWWSVALAADMSCGVGEGDPLGFQCFEQRAHDGGGNGPFGAGELLQLLLTSSAVTSRSDS